MEAKVKFFDYPLQFGVNKEKYLNIIEDTLTRGAYILGEDLERFERNLAKFINVKYAIGVSNCTNALLLSLHAAGIGPGDEVISVSHTFVATIEVIKFLGATPILIDISDDHNMDAEKIEAAITKKTKAIMPVQLNGHICKNMNQIMDIAKKHNLLVIEDAAQSLGAHINGKYAGTFGLTGCFSFYPAKLLGAFGDAGAIVTDDEAMYKKLKMLRNHGRGEGTPINMWGLNCRLDNLHGAVLDYKLTLLPDWIVRRREIAKKYYDGLSDIKELLLPEKPGADSSRYDVFQNYEIETENRDSLLKHMTDSGVQCPIQWGGMGVHQFEALDMGHFKLPRTERMFRNSLMLPLYPELEDEKIEYVISTVRKFFGK